MANRERIKLIAAMVFVVGSVCFMSKYLLMSADKKDKTFFYDLSEKRLFTAPRNAIPPIQGLHGTECDAVRAVVVSTNGNPNDKGSWAIAYLEKYSPELKRQMEQAQATGTSPQMGRGLAQAHRFVCRLSQTNWYSLASPEGEAVVSEWLHMGTGGTPAVICTP